MPDNLPQIAKQLGVTNMLEGSVQKSGDQVRVNVQLINALTDAFIWADTYDRKLIDIFAVESEIAKTIADTLQAKLSGSEKAAMSKKPTANPEAYELYLRGSKIFLEQTDHERSAQSDRVAQPGDRERSNMRWPMLVQKDSSGGCYFRVMADVCRTIVFHKPISQRKRSHWMTIPRTPTPAGGGKAETL